ncbi:MAG: hypothetical protein P1Q69_00940 [Candidatus Thorarchaeota archaeon]|nr:hypothetical protein [Candidatus Thorarchaeota archaeon]
MTAEREWILYIAGIVSVAIALVSNFMYPLNEMGILYILAFDATIIFGVFCILLLIQKRALEDW